ncbi:MAG: helix-turn-helix transcriptional regulator [Persicimonas sp.]
MLHYVADSLRSLLDSSHLLVVVVRAIAPKDGELDGLRPIFSREFGPGLDRRRDIRYRWMSEEPGMHQDPVLELAASGAGEPRTIRHRSDIAADAWADAPVRRLLEQLGVEDRLSALNPLTDRIEVHYLVDRPTGGALFDAREARLLLAATRELHRLSARLAWRHGLMPGQRQLDERELGVLDALLRQGNPDELAEMVGLSRTRFDETAAQVYDKLVVEDRADLLWTWLRGLPNTFEVGEGHTVSGDWVNLRVRQAIDDVLGEAELNLDNVAKRLSTAPESVQRALEATDTNFRTLADEARRERAKLLLSRPWLNQAEVAHQLGYQQVSSLNRAVKRWTGATPAELRASLFEED